MADDATDLPVLIVSFRSADLLEKCLRSVKTFHPGQDVLIWDNSGPEVSEVRELAERYPQFRWHFSEQNIGFAAAVNRLSNLVRGRDFLLLNPDAELLAPLEKTHALIRRPRVAAAAPMIAVQLEDTRPGPSESRVGTWYPEVTSWDNCYRSLTFLNAIGVAAGLGKRLRGSPLSRSYRLQPDEVDGYISGCCLAMRREAWDELGPFDEEFFLYGEEAEWQRKANQRGWKIRLADEVAVRHVKGGTVQGAGDLSQRSEDLLRSSLALQVEYIYGDRAAGFFLAWSSVFDGMKRLLRRTPAAGSTDRGVLVTADGPDDVLRSRIAIALAYQQEGYQVTVVALQRMGMLAAQLPPSIRLVRMAWWWPWRPDQQRPPLVVEGVTVRERTFVRLLRLTGSRLSPGTAFQSLE